MKLKFLAVTMTEYVGATGSGSIAELKSGDTFEFPDTICKILLRRYPKDFVEIKEEKVSHAPEFDKQYKKSSSFKGK